MATIKEIKELALNAAKGVAPTNYTLDTVNAALAGELKALASNYNQFMKNRYDIYEIFIETADEIVPKRVIDKLGMFAEVQQVGQGQKAMFRTSKGKDRARKFLTAVGLSGVYETFRLDSDTFEVSAHAIGGAATIDYERMLDGAESMAEVMSVLTDSIDEAVYIEVQKALRSALNAGSRPAANKVTVSDFDADEMVKLVNVVKSYGNGAVIFAPPEFITAMGPDAIVPVTTQGSQGVFHPQDIDMIHNYGRINIFRGTPIVEIDQSVTDESNTKTWIDPQLAYILPTGKEKVVKVTLEGNTQVRDWVNKDGSMEINMYKKMGVGIVSHHNWGIYQISNIPQTVDEDIYNI